MGCVISVCVGLCCMYYGLSLLNCVTVISVCASWPVLHVFWLYCVISVFLAMSVTVTLQASFCPRYGHEGRIFH